METIINQQISMPEKKNKTWLWIVVIILAAGLTGAGVYYWQNMEAKKMASVNEQKVRNEMQQKIDVPNNQVVECQQNLIECNQELTIASSTGKYNPLFPPIGPNANDKAGFELGTKKHIVTTNIIAKETSIENGTVYYTDTSGKKRAIVKSLDPDITPGLDDLRRIIYKKAELSPNKQFIALSSHGYEWTIVEIFDVTTGQLHLVGLGGDVSNLASWLPDNKLEIIGSCGMGILCGTYRSVNNEVPWIIDQYSTSTSKTQNDLCTIAPTPNEAGYSTYPIDEKYKNLRHLGELFTAADCNNPERLSKIFGVKGENYTIGANISLKSSPSTETLNTLKTIGFQCAEKVAETSCKQWQLKNTVKLNDFLKLKNFYQEIIGSDCINCG